MLPQRYRHVLPLAKAAVQMLEREGKANVRMIVLAMRMVAAVEQDACTISYVVSGSKWSG